ncbi:hypothetical protein A4H97_08425 [Niastella yeongjuensis]|uniref:SusE outer membrane protein domain-containing protein n=1 Tax=Niastella yeongjuensis TaxID=354355 RepID=A0A1V9ENI0_9BACT|nr:hypothetical protein [Niastella yeongjuensis]OQP47504.1 hypothetical protein A4H97_08425 [Niastella yeongjuensis]SEN87081.1 hypothetical protein SAMN05660816_01712 [Niastella yeongjuensis]
MKKILTVLALIMVISGAISCKKSSDDGNTNNNAKTLLIKLTLSPVPATNQGSFSGAINALLPNLNLATWKVNNVVRSNESTIAFSATDFQNGVLTLETTQAVSNCSITLSGVTTAQYPYTAVIQWTLNGKANDPITMPVTSTLVRTFDIL